MDRRRFLRSVALVPVVALAGTAAAAAAERRDELREQKSIVTPDTLKIESASVKTMDGYNFRYSCSDDWTAVTPNCAYVDIGGNRVILHEVVR